MYTERVRLWGACERYWCLEYLPSNQYPNEKFGPSNLFQVETKCRFAIFFKKLNFLKFWLTILRWISIKCIPFDALMVAGCQIERAHLCLWNWKVP